MVRILCIGNRFAYPDNFGMLIFDELIKLNLEDVEVVEGGVGGMSLMPYFEDDAKLLIVDYGVGLPNILTNKDIEKLDIKSYEHATSFLYLLKSVEKDYTIYLATDEFDTKELKKYVDDILKLVKGLQCK